LKPGVGMQWQAGQKPGGNTVTALQFSCGSWYAVEVWMIFARWGRRRCL
jgi:hypothetical protein